MPLDGVFDSLDVSGSALSAQSYRMKIITHNLAYAEVDSSATGEPYRRRTVSFHALLDRHARRHRAGVPFRGVEARVSVDRTPGDFYDKDGKSIEKSNVDVHREMVGLLQASRAYEANIAAVKAFREMVQRALQIGR